MGNTNIIRLANEFILEKEILQYPLKIEDLHHLAEDMGFYLYTFSEAEEFIQIYGLKEYTQYPAITFIKRNTSGEFIKAILYHGALSYGEKLFCILHEIGHIYLNHTYDGVLGKSPDENITNRQEQEADAFAYQVAAPICLLEAMDLDSIEAIESKTLLDGTRAEHVFVLLARHKENDEIEQKLITNYARYQLKTNPQPVYQREVPKPAAEVGDSIALPAKQGLLKRFSKQLKEFTRLHPIACTAAVLLVLVGAITTYQVVQQQNPPVSFISTIQTTPDAPTNQTQSDGKVLIGKSGERYHLPGCQYVNLNMDEVTVEEAEERGYTPCKRCFGES